MDGVTIEMKAVLQIVNRTFAGCKIGTVGNSDKVVSIVIDGAASVDLREIDLLVEAGGRCLDDIRVWGVGYVPRSGGGAFGIGEIWQPLAIEVLMLKRAPTSTTDNGTDASSVDGARAVDVDAQVVKDDDLRCIKDSNVRRIVGMFIRCMSMGECPDVYQIDLDAITYCKDADRDVHHVMFDAVPTLGLTFLRNVRYLFPSIRDIRFERKIIDKSAPRDETHSATVMIVTFSSVPTRGYERAAPPGRLTKKQLKYSPY